MSLWDQHAWVPHRGGHVELVSFTNRPKSVDRIGSESGHGSNLPDCHRPPAAPTVLNNPLRDRRLAGRMRMWAYWTCRILSKDVAGYLRGSRGRFECYSGGRRVSRSLSAGDLQETRLRKTHLQLPGLAAPGLASAGLPQRRTRHPSRPRRC